MTRVKKGLVLRPDEKQLLEVLYVGWAITTDNFPRFPDKLLSFTQEWNALSGRSDEPQEVLHYMITRRKKKEWVRLGHSKPAGAGETGYVLSEEEWEVLDLLYEEFQISSDSFALDVELAKKLQDAFAKRVGKIVPMLILSAAMIRRRKAGKLTTLRPKKSQDDLGFGDIDQLASG